MFRLLALTALLIVPMQLHAQADFSGNRLQRDCHLALSSQDKGVVLTSDEWLSVGYCYGRIQGVMNTLTRWHQANGQSKRTANGEACTPDDVTVHQATLVVMKYLDNNPDKLHLVGTDLIRAALKESYPCSE
jgi:hypothetical protein